MSRPTSAEIQAKVSAFIHTADTSPVSFREFSRDLRAFASGPGRGNEHIRNIMYPEWTHEDFVELVRRLKEVRLMLDDPNC